MLPTFLKKFSSQYFVHWSLRKSSISSWALNTCAYTELMVTFVTKWSRPFSASFPPNILSTFFSISSTHSSARLSSTVPEVQVLTRHPSCQTPPPAYTQIDQVFTIWIIWLFFAISFSLFFNYYMHKFIFIYLSCSFLDWQGTTLGHFLII